MNIENLRKLIDLLESQFSDVTGLTVAVGQSENDLVAEAAVREQGSHMWFRTAFPGELLERLPDDKAAAGFIVNSIRSMLTTARAVPQHQGVYKTDVEMALADALMRLGKNDWDGVRNYIKESGRLFEQWLKDRPEKKEGGGR